MPFIIIAQQKAVSTLARRPRQAPPSQYMEMKVVYGLPPALAGIADDAETALLQTFPPSDIADSAENVVAKLKLAHFRRIHTRYVHLRDNEDVHGSYGVNVAKANHMLVLVEDTGGDLPRYNPTENTRQIAHLISSVTVYSAPRNKLLLPVRLEMWPR